MVKPVKIPVETICACCARNAVMAINAAPIPARCTAPSASFSEAGIRGLAPDRGLYFPESTPRLDESFLADIATKSMVEIGVEVMRPFVGGTIPEVRLEKIVTDKITDINYFSSNTYIDV